MDLKIFAKTIEKSALDQINLLLEQDAFKDCKIRIMPDVHAGKGCVIGFTADLGEKVIPNLIGVDISCGVLCVKIGKIDINLTELDEFINKNIPSGFNVRQNALEMPFDLKELNCYDKLKNIEHIKKSLGTLGGKKPATYYRNII